MGKSNPTFRSVLERLATQEWIDYRRMLRRDNQELYDEVWKQARRHADAANAANPRPMDGALFSIAIEQQREIRELREVLASVKDEVGVVAGRLEVLEHDPSVDEIVGKQEQLEIEARAARGELE